MRRAVPSRWRLDDRAAGAEVSRLVSTLAAVSPRLDPEACAEALRGCDPDTVAPALVRLKVVLRGLNALAELAPDLHARVSAHSAVARRAGRLRAGAAGLDPSLDTLAGAADELGIEIQLVKGACARLWYDRPELRDMNDLDVLLGDAEDGLRLAHHLRRHGYEYEANEVPWLKSTNDGQSYGQVNLRYAGPGTRPNLDLHFGGYSVRHCARLAPPPRSGPGLSRADDEDNLVYLIANAAGDHLITAKDVNDVALRLRDPTTDWTTVLARLRDVDLLGFFGRILGTVAETCRFDASTEATVRRLVEVCGSEPVAPSGKLRWQRRWLSTVAHAYRHGRRASPAQAARATITAARYYRVPLRPGLARYGPLRMPRPTPWTCIRLFPAEMVTGLYGTAAADRETILARLPAVVTPLVGSGGLLDVYRTRRGDLVVSADTVFVPTVYHRLRADLVAALCR